MQSPASSPSEPPSQALASKSGRAAPNPDPVSGFQLRPNRRSGGPNGQGQACCRQQKQNQTGRRQSHPHLPGVRPSAQISVARSWLYLPAIPASTRDKLSTAWTKPHQSQPIHAQQMPVFACRRGRDGGQRKQGCIRNRTTPDRSIIRIISRCCPQNRLIRHEAYSPSCP